MACLNGRSMKFAKKAENAAKSMPVKNTANVAPVVVIRGNTSQRRATLANNGKSMMTKTGRLNAGLSANHGPCHVCTDHCCAKMSAQMSHQQPSQSLERGRLIMFCRTLR